MSESETHKNTCPTDKFHKGLVIDFGVNPQNFKEPLKHEGLQILTALFSGMTEAAGPNDDPEIKPYRNHRASEAESYARRYVEAVLARLQLPEGFRAETVYAQGFGEWQIRLMQIPDSEKAPSLAEDITAMLHEAHEQAIKAIGDPERNHDQAGNSMRPETSLKSNLRLVGIGKPAAGWGMENQ